jgi:hypothetical protein
MMYVNNGVTYKVQVNAVLNVSGVPTSRAIIAGQGLSGGGTLASNVTLYVTPGGIGSTELDNTGVTAAVYGDASNYPVITVDANGRITSATELAFPSISGYVPTSRQVIAGVGLSGGGALTTDVALDANLSNTDPEPVGTETSGVSDDISRADHVHPAIDLADTNQTVNELDITRGGTGTALTAPANGGVVYSDGNSLQVSTAGTLGQVLVSAGAAAPNWGSALIVSDQPANYFYAGPTSGPDAPTAFRAMVNDDLPASGVTANTYGSASSVPVFVVNSKGVITSVTSTTIAIGNSNLANSSITIGSTAVSLGGTMATLTGTSISGSTNTLSNIGNSSLTNSTVTIGSTSLALGGTLTTLAGTTISGSTNTLSNIGNSSLTNSAITINGNSVSLGGSTTVTATATNPLTIGTGLSGTSYDGSAPVTVAIDSTVATLTGVQTLTNKTLTTPIIETSAKILGTGVSSYTPFVNTLFSAKTQVDDYQLIYLQNTSNGTNASADYVAYNDVSDVNSYFVDMGINSSNYTNGIYTVFPANSGYLYTGGGSSGQASDLVIGTSNAASDIILFTGDTLAANVRSRIKGNTGNVLINTNTDNGYKLAVNGTTNFSGASSFGSTVTLHADPTLALQAATKQYVDNAVTSGIHIHEQVYAETSAALAAAYTQGGTNANIIQIANGTDITFFSVTPSVGDQFYIGSSSNGLLANTPYYIVTDLGSGTYQVSLTFGGAVVTGLTNGSPTIPSVINSGVGAYLESSANATFAISGVTGLTTGQRILVINQSTGYWNGVYTITSMGSGASKWKLTRSADASIVSPDDVDGLGTGDYFFVTTSSQSYVLTTENPIIIGYTTLTYTLFSSATVYTGTSPVVVTGSVISLDTVPATLGGTGTATVTAGDLLYGSGVTANTWDKLPLGIAYKSLVVNAAGTSVEWNAVALNETTAVAGTLGITNGGTGNSSYTNGQLLIGNSTGNTLTKTTLTAGTGISITNGSGSITVATNIDGGTF